jgi:hypothetical protein
LVRLAQGGGYSTNRLTQLGAVLGASTDNAFHSLCVIPQLAQLKRRRSPIVRTDQGSESIDDSSMTPSQTGARSVEIDSSDFVV